VAEKKDVPITAIAPADLQVVGFALFPYAQMIHQIIEPSAKRDTLLQTVEALRQRIAAVKLPEGEKHDKFLVTYDEVAVIDSALTVFVENIGRFIPQSQERDETMRACEALRSYLMLHLAPPDATTDE